MLKTIKLSIIVPVLNEEESVNSFLDVVIPVVTKVSEDYEILFVDDGSTDATLKVITERLKQNTKIRIISLSRNFGKDIALSAGLKESQGQAVIPMDVDLQDPPGLILELYEKYKEGYDTVIAVRRNRNSESIMKQLTAKLFYRFIGFMSDIHIPSNAGDFRLLDRRLVDVLGEMPERTRFMKGLFAWLGFKTAYVYFDRPVRQFGQTKWNYWKLWNFALDGIFSFSTVPLRVWSYIGGVLSMLSFFYMFWIIFRTFVFGIDVPGYASLLAIVLFMGGVNLIGIGILGEYVGRLFIEVKQRPAYIIDKRIDSGNL